MSEIQQLLEPLLPQIIGYVNDDRDFQASAAGVKCAFAVSSSEDPSTSILFHVNDYRIVATRGSPDTVDFGISARPTDWRAFFAERPTRPYQSYWGVLRVLGHHDGVGVLGDQQAFGRYARVWRVVLDRCRDAVRGNSFALTLLDPPPEEVTEEDAITGKYVWIEHSEYGKVKIFYEFSGSGPQTILFLHTAGSDGRQYGSLMNNKHLLERCTMYAFDLPAHGRSSLGSRQSPQGYALTENSYLESIGKVIAKLKLKDTIVCGASMAGHVCLAAAIRAKELNIHGAIPCEGCEHLAFTQPIYEIGGSDVSLLDPERVCGMCSPTSPEYYKRQIWWQYSSQGYGIFSGDLAFYFKGWDGRGRVETIDTSVCPIYMLTGEYDYSCTTEASAATAEKVPGAEFEAMEGLGHFPLTENPEAVLPYLTRALDHIASHRKSA